MPRERTFEEIPAGTIFSSTKYWALQEYMKAEHISQINLDSSANALSRRNGEYCLFQNPDKVSVIIFPDELLGVTKRK